jgi:ribosomal protein S18 acetylase RimI-like enzyme
MLNIIVDLFDEKIILKELVSLAYEVKKQYNILGKNETKEEIQRELETLRKNYKFILFRAYHETQLNGFILLFVNTPKFGIPWDWNPIVIPDKNDNRIASDLLKKCIQFSKNGDITRLEVCFTIENEAHKIHFLKQVKWYKELGFYRLAEEVTMELLLDKSILQTMTKPNNYEIRTLNQVNRDFLPQIAYEVFNDSEDMMFLSLGEEEKKVMCEKYFDVSEPIIEDVSFILLKDNNIIGFSVIKTNGDDAELNSIGIIPGHRNKGLAKLLLSLSLKKLIEKGFKKILLDVIKDNKSAYNLYLQVGFNKLFSTIIYAFNC